MTDRARFSATAIERLVDEPLDSTTKGLPFGGSTTLRSIADRGWNLFAGDLPFPLLVLYPDAIRHNIEPVSYTHLTLPTIYSV